MFSMLICFFEVEWKKDTRTEIVVILGVAVSVHKAFQEEREK